MEKRDIFRILWDNMKKQSTMANNEKLIPYNQTYKAQLRKELTKLKAKHNNKPKKDEPKWYHYIIGFVFTVCALGFISDKLKGK